MFRRKQNLLDESRTMKAVPVTMKQAHEFPLAYLKMEEGKVYKEAQNIEIGQVSSPQKHSYCAQGISLLASIKIYKFTQVFLKGVKVKVKVWCPVCKV